MADSTVLEGEIFQGAANHRLTFSIPEDAFREFLALCQENDWGESEEEALQIVFANGLAYLKNEREFARWEDQSGEAIPPPLYRLVGDLNRNYAVVKSHAFGYRQSIQTLEFNAAGLNGTLASLELAMEHLRADNERLKAELAKKS